ncbi:MAG: Nif3-like dinuclear metal center hexameric protein [Polyangiaceae bacterium]|jgi:dinuclear metal center YbgI/SA1388 family protein
MNVVGDLVAAMEEIAPPRLAASWDNVGLLVGDPESPLTRLLVAVDGTLAVLEEARLAGCEALVAYHPVIFAPLKRLVAGSVAFEAARAGLSVYCPHTALDAATGGTNDVLGDIIGLADRRPLGVAPPSPAPATPGTGFGRVGDVVPERLGELVSRLKSALGVEHVLIAGRLDRRVTRVALCAGSGGDLLADAVAAGADLFVTGELRHHDALRACEAGLAVVCTLHSVSERPALAPLAEKLRARLPGVAVSLSARDRDPFEQG